MDSQRPPFWEWPLDRLNGLILIGALSTLLILSIVNYALQRHAAELALETPTPALTATIAPTLAPIMTPTVAATVTLPITPTATVTTTPFMIVTPRYGARLSAPLLRIEGTAPANATVRVFDYNRRLGEIEADAAGAWALDLPVPLTDGDHLLRAELLDAQRRPVQRSAPTLVIILTAEPPRITAPTASTRLSARTTVAIRGAAMPDSLVRIQLDGKPVGEVNSDRSGAWQLTLARPLSRGQHRLRADLISPNGNILSSSAEVVVTVAP